MCPRCGGRRPREDMEKQQRPKERPQDRREPRAPRNNQRTAVPASLAKSNELGRSSLVDTEEDAKTSKESARDSEKEAKSQADAAWKKNQWTWDMSVLDKLESGATEEPSGMQKKDKRKNGQRGREDEDDHDEDIVRRREEKKRLKQQQKKEAEAAPSPLYLPEFISVTNLADVIGVRPGQFIERMEEMGFEDVGYNHVLDAETAGLVAAERYHSSPPRPPVVTIMGHVDHGKTTILDWLRKSSIAATEHGGITQHIGAFSVAMPSGKTITFLDTPGHSAFLEMRRRGADVTDIVVLVVAADDSVKPQTVEAIKHATQANVPIIVAISKVDKEGSNPDRVKADLSANGVHVEDYGGDVQAIPVSGKTGTGMLDLEEAIGALSEMLDHRADTAGNVEGWVLEASTKSYGRVASALIRRGTLRPGDVIVAGTTWARVRTLRNEAGVAVDEATPGMPVEIDGWREQPAAGTEILQAETEQRAKEVVEYRLERSETQKMGEDMAALNETRKAAAEKRRLENTDPDELSEVAVQSTGPKAINFIVKADVDGSAEAVLNSMAAIGNNEVYANILRSGVGPVTEFDIEHAATAGGKVISFNMAIDPQMIRLAEQAGVKIMDHNIIYKLIDDIKEDLSSHLAPNITHRVTGEAEVQQLFDITIKGREKMSIAGCRVRNGIIHKSRKVRVLRGDKTIYDGAMTSLKNVKKDVTEMRKDTECGIAFEDWAEFAVGDQVQCYEEIHEKRSL
ncbi:Translation initiation factor IF-2 [Penicillium chermesinum]|nr:Translation initiation factor IF-2 [Penicillium chermesinum]